MCSSDLCTFYSDTITVSIDSFALNVSLGPPDTISLCANNSIGLVQGDTLVTSYLWSTTDTTSTTPIDSSGNYWVTVLNFRGCVASDTIMVNIIGIAPVSDYAADTICFGDSTMFTDSSTYTPPDSIADWLWDFGDGNIDSIQNPLHFYDSAGIYNVVLTTTSDSGCIGTVSKQVLVRESPVAIFIFGPGTNGCVNNEINFYDESIVPGNDSIIDWNWDFGDTVSSNQQNPQHLYTSPGIYSVSLTISTLKGCSDSVSENITIVSNAPLPSYFKIGRASCRERV